MIVLFLVSMPVVLPGAASVVVPPVPLLPELEPVPDEPVPDEPVPDEPLLPLEEPVPELVPLPELPLEPPVVVVPPLPVEPAPVVPASIVPPSVVLPSVVPASVPASPTTSPVAGSTVPTSEPTLLPPPAEGFWANRSCTSGLSPHADRKAAERSTRARARGGRVVMRSPVLGGREVLGSGRGCGY